MILRQGVIGLLWAGAAACLAIAPARAQVMRKSIAVRFPFDMPRRAAEMAVDAKAKRVFVEEEIRSRLSSDLFRFRETEIRAALDPADAYAQKFAVQTRTIDGQDMKVVCEAEVDLGAVLFALVNNKVLSFGSEAPRILVVPGVGTTVETVKDIRARLRPTLGAAGLQLLAIEDMSAGYKASPDVGVVARQVEGARADLLAVVSLRSERAPSAVGGVVLDATLRYTVVRPGDNKILAEQLFTTRGSGATQLLAEQSVLEELGPTMARSLGTQLSAAVFTDGEVRDPGALSHVISLDVYYRPSPAATAALMEHLKQRNQTVRLGSGESRKGNRVGDASFVSKNATPVDRLIVEGNASVADLFAWFATAKFGPSQSYNASVIEYGDGYIGIEIVAAGERAKAPRVQKAPEPAATIAAPASTAEAPTLSGPRPPLQLHKKIR